jgi:hypothetical protein
MMPAPRNPLRGAALALLAGAVIWALIILAARYITGTP